MAYLRRMPLKIGIKRGGEMGFTLCWSFEFFFFQAEDGIRDTSVTEVQTCALPISDPGTAMAGPRPPTSRMAMGRAAGPNPEPNRTRAMRGARAAAISASGAQTRASQRVIEEDGRGAGRGRGGGAGGAGAGGRKEGE